MKSGEESRSGTKKGAVLRGNNVRAGVICVYVYVCVYVRIYIYMCWYVYECTGSDETGDREEEKEEQRR